MDLYNFFCFFFVAYTTIDWSSRIRNNGQNGCYCYGFRWWAVTAVTCSSTTRYWCCRVWWQPASTWTVLCHSSKSCKQVLLFAVQFDIFTVKSWLDYWHSSFNMCGPVLKLPCSTRRIGAAVLQQGRVDDNGAERALSYESDWRTTSTHYGQDGGFQYQFIDY